MPASRSDTSPDQIGDRLAGLRRWQEAYAGCAATNCKGAPCGQPPLKGSEFCRYHAGRGNVTARKGYRPVKGVCAATAREHVRQMRKLWSADRCHPLKITSRHTTVFVTNNNQEVMEVLTGPERRWRWSVEEKLAMPREGFEPGKTVSTVARRHGVNLNQLFHWRKLY